MQEINAENPFGVKGEDLKVYVEGLLMIILRWLTKNIPKNLDWFLTPFSLPRFQLVYWVKDRGNLARTAKARGPGQEIEIYEPFRAGGILHLKHPYDQFIKRKKCYLKFKHEFYNQGNVKKAIWIPTLILPREDVMKFVKGIHALES